MAVCIFPAGLNFPSHIRVMEISELPAIFDCDEVWMITNQQFIIHRCVHVHCTILIRTTLADAFALSLWSYNHLIFLVVSAVSIINKCVPYQYGLNDKVYDLLAAPSTADSSSNTMRFNSFSSTASALYNAVPCEIKSISTLNKFKSALDSFLQSFPDTPPTPGYTGVNGNSLVEWVGGKSQ